MNQKKNETENIEDVELSRDKIAEILDSDLNPLKKLLLIIWTYLKP